jgi:hypothetical protein
VSCSTPGEHHAPPPRLLQQPPSRLLPLLHRYHLLPPPQQHLLQQAQLATECQALCYCGGSIYEQPLGACCWKVLPPPSRQGPATQLAAVLLLRGCLLQGCMNGGGLLPRDQAAPQAGAAAVGQQLPRLLRLRVQQH